jgi:hypothetical protein
MSEKAVAASPSVESLSTETKGGNELLLRFFQSEWFTPAVRPIRIR